MCFGDTHVVFRDPEADHGSQSTARAAESPRGIRFTETKRAILIALCRPSPRTALQRRRGTHRSRARYR